ncbi:B-type cyclin [Coemansia javaensis]|uniref:B-type cyclin n=1 Tax=Coemansia javaensis TaxID=2761396 RepID=A0A9W8LFQ7_9FUNG|nr:B-type cyclin [Coemansia javaensis]
MTHRSRIPVRRTAAAAAGVINDENKVGAVTRGIKPTEPVKAVGGMTTRLATATATVAATGAGPKPMAAAKVFGTSSISVANARARSALGDIGAAKASQGVVSRSALGDSDAAKVQGIVSRLAKPSEVAARLQPKPLGNLARAPASGIARPTVTLALARQPSAPAAVGARPAASNIITTARPSAAAAAARAPALAARPISKPGPSFGLRRAHPPAAEAAPAPAPAPAAAAAAEPAAGPKRVRTAASSVAAPMAEAAPMTTITTAAAASMATTSLLGKHTRSGRVTRGIGSGAGPTVAHLSLSSDSGATAVESAAPSLKLSSVETSPATTPTGAGDSSGLSDLKFVDVDTIDYALAHTGLLNEQPITLAEIDEFDSDVNPLDQSLVPEFSDDIFGYMREMEVKLMATPNYMARQSLLSWESRALLVEWLVQVHHRFNLLPETLYLTMNYVDRVLSVKEITIDKVQLVGAVCLLLASKYEEMYVPSVADMVFMVSNSYSAPEILRAERYVLELLNFDLGWPSPLSFLRRISKADSYDMATRTLAKYLMEVTLMDGRFVGVPCSKIAAAAHYLSLRLQDKGPWTRRHAYYSGYFESELAKPVTRLLQLLMDPHKHRAIYIKYADRRFLRASEFVYKRLSARRPEALLVPAGADCEPGDAPDDQGPIY